MRVTPVKTHKITAGDNDLSEVIDRYIPHLGERSIVVITSKIVALCEGRVVNAADTDIKDLIIQESERYLAPEGNNHNVTLTITRNILIPTAGIDESNAEGNYVLWPKDAAASARAIRKHLEQKHGLKEVGVIITDSTTAPLRWGVFGISIGHSGFASLHDYRGKPDIFGRPLEITRASVAQSLAAAAVITQGEGSEQTPLAIIDDVPFVDFLQTDVPEPAISVEDDLYAQLLLNAAWLKGAKYNE